MRHGSKRGSRRRDRLCGSLHVAAPPDDYYRDANADPSSHSYARRQCGRLVAPARLAYGYGESHRVGSAKLLLMRRQDAFIRSTEIETAAPWDQSIDDQFWSVATFVIDERLGTDGQGEYGMVQRDKLTGCTSAVNCRRTASRRATHTSRRSRRAVS